MSFEAIPGRSEAYKAMIEHFPAPYQVHFPVRLTELEFLEMAHYYDAFGVRIDDVLKIKVKRLGPHRMFIIERMKGEDNA